MATAQLVHSGQKPKTSKETVLFPNRVATEQQSTNLVKRLLAISISCITYLRGLFPESSYGTRYLDDMCLKILREDKSCLGSLQIVKWIQGCFDALEKHYLHMAVLAIYTNPQEPEQVTELYQFKFKYSKSGAQMDFASSQVSVMNRVNSEEIKEASILLIRKLYVLMQNLGPLPNDISLTMKLFYYNDVTPDDYQPPGFKEGSRPDCLLFDGNPVNLKVGSMSTGFHVLKVRVTTESKRMGTLESSLVEESSPTEISHEGLDCEEEEEENSTKVQEQAAQTLANREAVAAAEAAAKAQAARDREQQLATERARASVRPKDPGQIGPSWGPTFSPTFAPSRTTQCARRLAERLRGSDNSDEEDLYGDSSHWATGFWASRAHRTGGSEDEVHLLRAQNRELYDRVDRLQEQMERLLQENERLQRAQRLALNDRRPPAPACHSELEEDLNAEGPSLNGSSRPGVT
uniref:HORMA domain-containing protein 2 n=1 Tax=Euleptes europaea TaxID=460621 RepID=UPI0025413345|nr:HORMA domain-containing protein 2 [Euleptes europaea]